MPSSVITGGSAFQFKDFVLQGVLTRWNHRIGIRLASHEYLKRDGGEQEPMGAAVGRFSYSCVLIGPDVTARYNNLVLSVRRDPRGILVDPRLGRIQAACEGIDAAEVAEDAVDSIEFDIRFAEDQVDSALASEQPVSPNAYSANVLNSITTLTDLVDARFLGNFATSFRAVVALLPVYTAAATAYTTAALASIQSASPDPTLQQLLGAVRVQQDAFLAALTATLQYSLEPDVSLTPYRDQARQIFDGCLQLQDSISALKPPIILYPVTTAMPLTQVAVALYGKDAKAKVPELRSLNRIAVPYWIPQGTILKAVAPVVRQ